MLLACSAAVLVVTCFCSPTTGQTGEKQPAEKVKFPEIRKELLERKDKEQILRFETLKFNNARGIVPGQPASDPKVAEELKKLTEKLQKEDEANRNWLKGVIDKHGWPGKSLVGKDGAFAAWLLVQHADPDRPFQKRCLELMKALPPGEVQPENIAYLTDRVLVGEKKKQLYGTQLQANAKGEYVPQPIEDEAHVDQRRQEMGMQPLAEYLKIANSRLKQK